MADIHLYPVTVKWSGGRDGTGSVAANRTGHETTLSVPMEFGGPGTGANPEELLTSAIASCYSITFGIIASARKLEYVSLRTDAIGEVEQPNSATFIYNKITLKPTITLPAGADAAAEALAEDLAHKADTYCIVTNAVRGKAAITVEPTIIKA